MSEAWPSRPAARALFGNYSTFDLVRSASNPMTIGALASLLLTVLLYLRRRRERASPTRASSAGGRSVLAASRRAESATYCTQCIHIYLKRDGVSLDTKRQKLEEVTRAPERRDPAQPLLRHVPAGHPRRCSKGARSPGVIGMFLLAFFVSRGAALVGRLAPALGPSADTAQTARAHRWRLRRRHPLASALASGVPAEGGSAKMALEGTLRDFSLADIFQLIGLQRKTGVLTLRSEGRHGHGDVPRRQSRRRRLARTAASRTGSGTVLIRRPAADPGPTQPRAGDPEGDAAAPRLHPHALRHHFGGLAASEAHPAPDHADRLRLFRWKDGEYHFSQETTIEYDRDNVVPISAESILMEGARMIDEWPIIEKRIRSYDMVFRKKLTDQEIVVVGADEADEIDFDGDSGSSRRRKAGHQRQDPHLRAKRSRSTTWSTAR